MLNDPLGYLMAYSESLLGPAEAPRPPLMARQSALSTPAAELPLPTPSATPTATATPAIAPAPTPAAPPPAVAPQAVASEKVVLRGVLFARNSADLDAVGELVLDEAARTLKAHPNVRIYVKGYSDARGNPQRNQKLSQERAATVAAYLMSKGVPLSQLIVLGMGSTHPIASNATAAGRALNRRVELEPVIE